MKERHSFPQTVQIWVLLAILVGAGLLKPAPAGANALERFLVPSRYFAETQHNVGGPFLEFYEAHGGTAIFGLPLTEVFDEQGMSVQYFEHARLELQPGYPPRIEITAAGQHMAQHRIHEPAFARSEPGPKETSTYFPATGHNLSHQFREFWHNHGGHPLFGYPVSEAFSEYHEQDGQVYTVQYFEQMRLEYRLEHPGGSATVRIGALGRDYANWRNVPPEALESARPLMVLGNARVQYQPLPGDEQNIALAARQFDRLKVMPGEEVSYLETVGELTSDTGYVPGSAIVGSGGAEVIAGGICYLSTAIFQAVLRAGLEVVERHPHTALLPGFDANPGMDSAVFTADGKSASRGVYDLDLRWLNDTSDPIIMVTEVITRGDLSVSLWGYSDGRQTTIHEPYIQDKAPPDSIWRYDASLARCEVQQIASGSPAMSVTVEREVQAASGDMLHEDRYYSSYTPYRNIFVYGPGIVPVRDGSSDPSQTAREQCEGQQ